jgi:hypothetical protein
VHTSALLRCCWSPSNSTEPAPDQSWQYSASQLQNKKQSLVERAVSQVMWPGSLSNPISETVGSPVPEKSALSEISAKYADPSWKSTFARQADQLQGVSAQGVSAALLQSRTSLCCARYAATTLVIIAPQSASLCEEE